MPGNIPCLQAGQKVLQRNHICPVSGSHCFMDKSGSDIGLSSSGTACQKQVVCLPHPYQLAQFAQLSGIDSFRSGKVVTVQIMPCRKPGRFQTAQILPVLPVPDLLPETGEQKLRIGQLLFLGLMQQFLQMFGQIGQLEHTCTFHEFLLMSCHIP